MKQKILILALLFVTVLTGCGKKTEDDIYRKFKSKVENSKNYHLAGELELINNDSSYMYDVDVSYASKDKFKVSLRNQINGHEQIVLRNDEGVYVVTPSLNKSFKFQSEWPYNNSQAYLLQTILTDLENDSERVYEVKGKNHVFTSKVNYSNNNDLVKQKVYIGEDYIIDKVEVLDKDGNKKIIMKFNDVDMDATYNDDYFDLDKNVNFEITETDSVSSIEDIIYPMYIPINTNLSDQETIKTENGERVILTFEGEKSFMFIQETVSVDENMDIIPVNGEPVVLNDSIGALTPYSISWYNSGKEYYLVSSILDESELLQVANSISSVPVIK